MYNVTIRIIGFSNERSFKADFLFNLTSQFKLLEVPIPSALGNEASGETSINNECVHAF